jgi:hypothetical protein
MLRDLLEKKRSEIVARWLELVFDTYPLDTSKFLRNKVNRFANPVGSTISDAVEKLYSGLAQGVDLQSEEVCLLLDNIVRIRAVQEFSPAHAVGFIFLLKKVVRETLAPEIRQYGLVEDLLTFESRIDNLALLAFDIYMQCREKIFEIRATEIRNRTSRILERACQKYGMPHEW